MRSLFHPAIERIRKHHALEHATVHELAAAHRGLRLVGRSDGRGFWLYGNVSTPAVLRAVQSGLHRLRQGEAWLAVHPRCGTNIAATALLTGGGAWAAALLPGRSRLGRLTRVMVATMTALALGRSLGLLLQRHVTTTPDMDGIEVEEVRRLEQANMLIHRVLISSEGKR